MALSETAYPWARYSARIRERGLSSWSTLSGSWVVDEPSVDFGEDSSSRVAAELTWTRLGPSWVLSRSRAVLAAVGFSNVTAADWTSPSEVMERLEILPQKLKKSRT